MVLSVLKLGCLILKVVTYIFSKIQKKPYDVRRSEIISLHICLTLLLDMRNISIVSDQERYNIFRQ
jgi:hypothetical protein